MRYRLIALLIAVLPWINAGAIDVARFERVAATPALALPYRAIVTPGRLDEERLPLIVFLHGSGQSGSDNEAQINENANGALELVDTAIESRVPLVFVAPQSPEDYWPPRAVAGVIADAMARYPVDARRIIVTGLSAGGTGVWDALKTYPSCFAAGVPMSGMTELAGLASIRDVPQWIFHGDKDDDTNVDSGYGGAMVGSRTVVRALRAMGGAPIYTEYAGGKHVIWPRAFGDEKLLPWLLRQRLPGSGCDFAASAASTGPEGASQASKAAQARKSVR